jgi:hypothetical protein
MYQMLRIVFLILAILIASSAAFAVVTERDLSYLTATWTSPEGVIFDQGGSRSSGTGTFDSFVRLAHKDHEKGYNTDYRLVQFDELTAANWTHALPLATVPVVMIGGAPYREIKLDINEQQNEKSAYISLDELLIFETDNPNLTGMAFDAGGNYVPNPAAGWPAAAYDLDHVSDNYIKLDARLGPGSGMGDMSVYIPASLLVNSGPYLTVYSEFGNTISSDAGFEEWAIMTAEPVVPEPASLLSLAVGLTGLIGLAVRKRR